MSSPQEILSVLTVVTPRRISIASPISTYGTPRYDQLLTRIAAHFPRADLVPARGLFQSHADWQERWPAVLATIDAVCIFPDEAGWIGRGVWVELQDARCRKVPVFFVDDAGGPHPSETVRLCAIAPDDWRQYALLAFEQNGGE